MVVGMGSSRSVQVGIESTGADQFTRDVQSAEGALEGLRSTALVAGAALTGLGLAGAAAISDLTSRAREVETAFAEVSTLLGEGQDAAEIYGEQIGNLTSEYAVHGGETETIAGLYQTLSAGFTDAAESTMVLEQSLALAAAGFTDTETAIGVVAGVINGYGMEAEDAEKVSDILFTTVRTGVTTMDELGSALGRAVPFASTLGVSLEELTAGIATLTAGGLSTAESVTAMRAAFVEMMRPSENLQTIFADLGYETGQAAVEALGMQGALQAVADRAAETGVPLTDVFGSVEALNAVLPLTGDAAEKFAENLLAAEESAGATDLALSKVQETADFKLRAAMNELNVAFADFGAVLLTALMPAIEAVIGGLTDLMSWFTSLPGPVQEAAAVGLVLVTALSLLAGTALLASVAFGALAPVILGAGAALGVIAGAALAVAAPLLVLAGLAVLLYVAWQNNFLGIQQITADVFNAIKEIVGGVIEFFKGIFQTITQIISGDFAGAWTTLKETITTAVNGIWDTVWNVFTSLIDLVVGVGADIVNAVREWWPGLLPIMTSLAESLVAAVTEWGPKILTALASVPGLIVSAIVTWGPQLVTALANIGIALFNEMVSWGPKLVEAIVGAIDGLIQAFIDFGNWLIFGSFITDMFAAIVTAVVSGMADFLNAVIGAVAGIVAAFVGLVADIVTTVVGGFVEVATAAVTGMANMLSAVVTGIANVITAVVGFAADLVATIIGAYVDAVSAVVSGMANILTAVVGGIADVIAAVVGFAADLVATIVGAYVDAVSAVVGGMADMLSAVVGGIADIISAVIGFAADLVAAIVGAFADAVAAAVGGMADILGAVTGGIADILGAVAGFVSDFVSSVTNGFNDAKDAAIGAVTGLKDGVINGFNAVKSAVTDAIGNIKDAIVGGFQDAVSKAQSVLSSWKPKLPKLPQIKFPKIKLPKIPKFGGGGGGGGSSSSGGSFRDQIRALGHGGIVTKPTRAVIGEAGEAEAVLPLSRLEGMMTQVAREARHGTASGRGGTPVAEEIHVHANNRTQGREAGEAFLKELRSAGFR